MEARAVVTGIYGPKGPDRSSAETTLTGWAVIQVINIDRCNQQSHKRSRLGRLVDTQAIGSGCSIRDITRIEPVERHLDPRNMSQVVYFQCRQVRFSAGTTWLKFRRASANRALDHSPRLLPRLGAFHRGSAARSVRISRNIRCGPVSAAPSIGTKPYLDKGHYETGIKITDQQMQQLNLLRHDQNPEWNYSILPRISQ